MHLATTIVVLVILGGPVQGLPIEGINVAPIPVEDIPVSSPAPTMIQFSPPDPIFDDVTLKFPKTPQELLRLNSLASKKPVLMEGEMNAKSDPFAFDFSQDTRSPATLLDSITVIVRDASVVFYNAVGFISKVKLSFHSPPVRTTNHRIYNLLNVDHLSVNEDAIDDGSYPLTIEEGKDIKNMKKDWEKFEKLMTAFVRPYLPDSDRSTRDTRTFDETETFSP